MAMSAQLPLSADESGLAPEQVDEKACPGPRGRWRQLPEALERSVGANVRSGLRAKPATRSKNVPRDMDLTRLEHSGVALTDAQIHIAIDSAGIQQWSQRPASFRGLAKPRHTG